MRFTHAVEVLIVMCGLVVIGRASAGHIGHHLTTIQLENAWLDGRHRWSREGKVAKVEVQ